MKLSILTLCIALFTFGCSTNSSGGGGTAPAPGAGNNGGGNQNNTQPQGNGQQGQLAGACTAEFQGENGTYTDCTEVYGQIQDLPTQCQNRGMQFVQTCPREGYVAGCDYTNEGLRLKTYYYKNQNMRQAFINFCQQQLQGTPF